MSYDNVCLRNYDSSKFYLSSPGWVTSDDTPTSDCSTADVRQVLAVHMLTAWRRDRMFNKNWVCAWLQHSEESVCLGWWSVELGLRLVVVVQPLSDVVHRPFPGSLLGGNTTSRLGAAAMDLDGDVYSPMKAENTQLQETDWTEDRQTY